MQPLYHPFPVASTELSVSHVQRGQDRSVSSKSILKVIQLHVCLNACLPLRSYSTCMFTSQKLFYLHVYISEVILPACLHLRSDSTCMFTSQKWCYWHVYLSEVILLACLPIRSNSTCMFTSQKWFFTFMFTYQKWFYLRVFFSEVILTACLLLRSDLTCMFTSQKWFYLHVYLCTWLWCRCQHGKVVLVRVGPWLMPSMFLMPDWPPPCQKSTPPLGLTTKHFIQVHRPVTKHVT